MDGNAVVQRFRFNNVVIGSIGPVGTVAVVVAVPAGSVQPGMVGFGVPVDASYTAGLSGMIACRATSNAAVTMYFPNSSAGAIDPIDSFDFDIFLFPETGNVITV